MWKYHAVCIARGIQYAKAVSNTAPTPIIPIIKYFRLGVVPQSHGSQSVIPQRLLKEQSLRVTPECERQRL